ncbi:MAG TPA: hypothetical protein VMT03_10800 [Polyangia bacterium]|nr:hypothetical protein [Polyangia bacterium]
MTASPGDLGSIGQAGLEALRGVTDYPGTLTITGGDVVDLSPLACLTTVQALQITSTQLTTLAGLSRLTSVGDLEISLNGLLTSMAALASLTHVSNLTLIDNEQLASLDGLQNLTVAAGTIAIGNNAALTSLAALDHLTSAQSLRLTANPALTSPKGLDNAHFSQSVYIEGGALTSLDGLGLSAEVQDITIMHLPLVSSLEALAAVQSVQSSLTIQDLPAVSNLNGLRNLASVGTGDESAFLLLDELAVSDLTGLGGLTYARLLEVSDSPSIASLSGLNPALVMDQGIQLINDQDLADISALGKVQQPPTSIQISGCQSLVTLAGLENVRTVTLLDLDGDSALVSLHALSALRTANLINIEGNTSLPTCEAKWLVSRIKAPANAVFIITYNDDSGTCGS